MTQQINLYDSGLLRKREWFSANNLALASILLLSLVILLGTWTRIEAARLKTQAAALEPQVKDLRDQMTALGQELTARKPSGTLAQELANAQEQLKTHMEILAMLRQGLGPKAPSFAEYLRGFARQTPQGVWLTGVTIEGDGGMGIQGRTLDPALIPEYIRRLNGEKAFQGLAFAALHMEVPAPASPLPGAAGSATQAPSPPRYHEFMLKPMAAVKVNSAAAGGQR